MNIDKKSISDEVLKLKPSLRIHAKRRLKLTGKLASELMQNFNVAHLKFGYKFKMSMSGNEGAM